MQRACTAEDWRQAGELIDEHSRWLVTAVGVDIRARQAGAGTELADPARFYRPPGGTLILARIGGGAAGIVGVRRLHHGVGELKRMYVRLWARGNGLGRALVTEAVKAAGELGFRELWLQTEPTAMAAAAHLYRAAGFTDIRPYADLGIDGVATLGLVLDPARVEGTITARVPCCAEPGR
jgi:GNAT superfamily N-acetyltransferase